jgi:hypothetical protein
MKPYLSLGIYRPTRWRASVVGRELTDLTASLGLVPHFDPVHGPLELKGRNWASKLLHAEVRRRTFATKQAEGWHFDGDTTPGSRPDCAIVLWCSNSPTEIKWQKPVLDDGDLGYAESVKVWQPKPYEVVIFHNLHVLHRRPAGASRVRYVFRQRVQIPQNNILRLP